MSIDLTMRQNGSRDLALGGAHAGRGNEFFLFSGDREQRYEKPYIIHSTAGTQAAERDEHRQQQRATIPLEGDVKFNTGTGARNKNVGSRHLTLPPSCSSSLMASAGDR